MNTIESEKPSINSFAMQVVREVAERHGCTPAEVLGPRRFEHITMARQMAFWLLRKEPYELQYNSIGRFFRRNHAAVIHGCRKTNDRLEIDKQFQRLWPEYTDQRVTFRVDSWK